jgi:hypothetical protein
MEATTKDDSTLQKEAATTTPINSRVTRTIKSKVARIKGHKVQLTSSVTRIMGKANSVAQRKTAKSGNIDLQGQTLRKDTIRLLRG